MTDQNKKICFFLASTENGKDYVKKAYEVLNHCFKCNIWYELRNSPGLLPTLVEKNLRESDFLMLIFTKDDIEEIGGEKKYCSDNLFFELGFFIGDKGISSVLLLTEKINEKIMAKLPEDIEGLQVGFTKKDFYKNIEKIIVDIKNRVYRQYFENKIKLIFGRNECYKIGRDIIKCDDFNINTTRCYSIISYDNELGSNNTDLDLSPNDEDMLLNKMTIASELKKYSEAFAQQLKSFNPSIWDKNSDEYKLLHKIIDHTRLSGKNIKRYMNLGNNKILQQAKYIFMNYFKEKDALKIMDTYCRFIEVIITDDRVLIVLPNFKSNGLIAVGIGIIINDKEAADEFAEWFDKLIPEPNKIEINNLKDLNTYIKSAIRKEGNRLDSCEACIPNNRDNNK